MDQDLLLAKQLQEKFNREENGKRKSKVSPVKTKTANSIVDPEWDLHDPNPDIHTLFQVFNAKFFWNQLGCVEVKWSPRMYSCAGICTYKGVRGCVVSLSLPLLKLRPRKDLVETLLHEMIHAYLFVTDKNSEREEHGPKFHSHMYRINKEAGTNITVYHTFHDEVKHYRTHWWRCNGTCQSKPPFFGLVKRSMNRAPGPNDFWFAEHQRNCGGVFIKIKEPDGFKSRKSKKTVENKENAAKQPTLDKYLSPPKISTVNKNISEMSNCNKKDNTNNVAVEKFGKTNNVHGFKGLTTPNKKKPESTNSNSKGGAGTNNIRFGGSNFGGVGMMSNRGGTLVERPRTQSTPSTSSSSSSSSTSSPPKTKPTLLQTTFTPYSGVGQVLDPNCKPNEINRANSRLLKLYPPTKSSNDTVQPTSSKQPLENPPKKLKIDENDVAISLIDHDDDEEEEDGDDVNLVNCPVCNSEMPQNQVNDHLDVCINLKSVMESVTINDEENDDNDDVVLNEQFTESISNTVNCPSCDQICNLDNINQHLDQCLQTV